MSQSAESTLPVRVFVGAVTGVDVNMEPDLGSNEDLGCGQHRRWAQVVQ